MSQNQVNLSCLTYRNNYYQDFINTRHPFSSVLKCFGCLSVFLRPWTSSYRSTAPLLHSHHSIYCTLLPSYSPSCPWSIHCFHRLLTSDSNFFRLSSMWPMSCRLLFSSLLLCTVRSPSISFIHPKTLKSIVAFFASSAEQHSEDLYDASTFPQVTAVPLKVAALPVSWEQHELFW